MFRKHLFLAKQDDFQFTPWSFNSGRLEGQPTVAADAVGGLVCLATQPSTTQLFSKPLGICQDTGSFAFKVQRSFEILQMWPTRNV